MAPSFFKLGAAAALAYASASTGQETSYQLVDDYSPNNFFSKFNFFEVSKTRE